MLRWQHVILGSRCSWLHGDRRGFRDRHHRSHSTGDYKNRPPEDEFEGLRRYYQDRSGKPVDFDLKVRILICRTFVLKLIALGYRPISCTVARRHLHIVAELPEDYREKKKVIGKCKQKSSHAVRLFLPGTIWSDAGDFRKINDVSHLHNAYNYLRFDQDPGAIVWSHRPDEDWITDESVGVIVMAAGKQHLRVFPTERRV